MAPAEIERDRHGRLLAQLFTSEGPEIVWVQGRLVEEGHARAYTLPRARACASELMARETRARDAGAGLWRERYYALGDAAEPEKLARRRYSYQIVEGRVTAVGRTRRWTFVNFGPDYKRDFTIAVRAGDRRRFAEAGLDLAALEGKRLRVRGWLERWNGPVIKATHPEQIEILEGPPDAPKPAPEAKKNPAPKAPGSLDL